MEDKIDKPAIGLGFRQSKLPIQSSKIINGHRALSPFHT